jgi:class 3 adenylate cyclase
MSFEGCAMFVLITIGLNLLNAILGFMGYLCYGGIVVVLGSQLVNAATSSENFGLLKSVANFVEPLQKPVIDFLHAHIPCIYGKFDAAPAMIGLVFLLMCMGFDHLAHRVRVYRLSLIERRKLAERQEAIKLQGEAYLVAAEAEKDPSKREKLIEVYARTKKMIEEQKKHMAFLSIDVVNSTGMKNGEDPVLAERDFRNFRKLVERIINEHGMLKTAWTPDGMMIGFATVQDAVGAAKTLIRSMACFNRDMKSMKADFNIRCGVNTGEVLFDESVPMEEMAHGVIDVAGHMQKYASENTIYVGGPVAEEVGALGGFRPAYKQVDGLEVYEWRPAFEADSRA